MMRSFPRHVALSTTLVGRGEEFRTSIAALTAAQASAGSTVLIAGEAGIGKSRLARDVAAEARRRGVSVLSGQAVRIGSPLPFRPLVEALHSYLRVTGVPNLPELEPFRPALGRLVPEWQQARSHGADDSIAILGEAVLQLLRVLAASQGCLLVLEDLQWADPETLAIVEYLSDNLHSEPMLCLGTLRSEEASPALGLAHALQARRAALILDLSHLTDDDVDRMAQSCLSGSPVPEAVAMFLRLHADGLPFLVEELLAAMIGSEMLVHHADGWIVAGQNELMVPITFADTLRERLCALGDTPRHLLHVAAILGQHFDWTLLPRVTGIDAKMVLAVLRRATDAQLIGVEAAGAYSTFRFRHTLTRDAVLAELLPPERVALSRRVLEAIQAAHPGLPGAWCQLAAELASIAGEDRQAAVLLLEAGRRALAQGALASAETTLDRARQLDVGDSMLSAEIDESLTEVLSLAGKTDRVFQVGEELLHTLLAVSAPLDRRAQARLLLARVATTAAHWREAAKHLKHARRLAVDAAAQRLLPRIDALAAHVAIGSDRPDEATALARAALVAAERASLPEVACEALEVIGRCARLHSLAQAEAAFGHARALAEEHGLAVWRIRALHELGTIDLLSAGPLDRLIQTRELAMQAGALATAAVVDLQIAAGHLFRFELDGALEAAHRSAEVARRFRLDSLLGMDLVLQAAAHAYAGRRAEMKAAIADALAIAGDHPDVAASVWGERANLSLLQENRTRALRQLDRAMEIARLSPSMSPHPLRGMWALLRTVEGIEGEAACAEVRASGVTVQRLNQGHLSYAEAIILGRAGRRSEAEAAFARGDADLRSMPWYRHLARRLVAEAATADGWGDPVAWLREAAIFFEDQGHGRVVSACRSLLHKAGVPVSRRGRGESDVPSGLRALGVTSREMDVLLLLAEGLSSKEISMRLFISPRTVEKHVTRLRAKTGTKNRSHLIALCHVQGFLA